MRRAIAVAAVLLLAGSAWAAVRVWGIDQALTGTAPTATNCATAGSDNDDATCGMNIGGAKAVRVCVQAAAGQTLGGAGALNLYVFNVLTGTWGLDKENSVNVDASGVRMQCWTRQVVVPLGRIFPVPSAVTASGGTTVKTTVEGYY